MMKVKKIALIAFLGILLTGTLKAQESGFGIGAIFGSPTGVSLKLWTGETTAFDASLAWSFYDDGYFAVNVNYLWHKFGLIKVDSGKLPLYFGVGAKMGISDNFHLGVRIPVGLDYMFSEIPLDVFVELAPSLMLIPATTFQFDGGIGVRYFF